MALGMALSRRMAAAPVLLLLLLLVATELGTRTVVEATRDCKSPSHKFKGMCFSDSNCAVVCGTEGFTRGECSKTFKCDCKKPC